MCLLEAWGRHAPNASDIARKMGKVDHAAREMAIEPRFILWPFFYY